MLYFKQIVLINILAFFFSGCLENKDDGKKVNFQPYLQLITKNSIVVKWKTLDKERGCVDVEINSTFKQFCEKDKVYEHYININGLKENTSYKYNVISSAIDIDNNGRVFKTLSSNLNESQKIWVVGDSGVNNDYLKGTINVFNNIEIDTFLLLGDNAYGSGTSEQYRNAFFAPFKEILKTNVPWIVSGNHDTGSGIFYDIFDLPTKGESGGEKSGHEEYYSFEKNNVHYVMLESEAILFNYKNYIEWLEKDLRNNNKKWVIVAFHHPPYTKGDHESDDNEDSHGIMTVIREQLNPIFEKYDVDLVLSGHSHQYERSHLIKKHYGTSDEFTNNNIVQQSNIGSYTKCIKKIPYNGTLYNVAGSTAKGKSNTELVTNPHNAMPITYKTAGSLLLTIEGNNFKSEFISFEGEIIDTYTIEKINCDMI